MSIKIKINQQDTVNSYIGWSPIKCSLQFNTIQPSALNAVLQCRSKPDGGTVVFLADKAQPSTATLAVTIPADSSEVTFYIAGSRASTNDQDVSIEIKDTSGALLAEKSVMVRIRKNANDLTTAERDRFLDAYVKFNLKETLPNYTSVLDKHNEAADQEIHTTNLGGPRPSFLPWHRAFILELERELQKIDPSVALPYWKFDEPAPKVFTADFMGADTTSGTVRFSGSNKLQSWSIDGNTGVIRKGLVNLQTSPGHIPGAVDIRNDAGSLALGDTYTKFNKVEFNPHGYAHSCFEPGAPLGDPTTAPQDPLFFLLHCNVDRIWAAWQKKHGRYDHKSTNSYSPQGDFAGSSKDFRIGDYVMDIMWPWNGDKGSATSSRPPTAPGGKFPPVPNTGAPSATPGLWEMIDYQGYNVSESICADYDSIPYFDTHTIPVFAVHANKLNVDADSQILVDSAFAAKLKSANTMSEIIEGLELSGQHDPLNINNTEKLVALASDKAENKNMRLKAIKAVNNSLFEDTAAVKSIIAIMIDPGDLVEVRRAALNALKAVSFASPALGSLKPEFKNGLRTMLSTTDPELLRSAVELLASYKDEVVQKLLVDGLKDKNKAILKDGKAIQLLRLDIRSDFKDVIREKLEKTKNPDTQIEAILALSSDSKSQNLIKDLLKDKNTDKDVRIASISALNAFNDGTLLTTLKNIIEDNSEGEDIRTASLNIASLQPNIDLLYKDQGFSSIVEGLTNSGHEDLKKVSGKFLLEKNILLNKKTGE